MSKYLVLAQGDDRAELSMEFEFDNTGRCFLKKWSVTGEWDADFWRWVWTKPPLTKEVLLSWFHPQLKEIKEVPEDLSFARFWDLYDYKMGSKAKAEKAWNEATEADKIAALAAIPKYNFWLSTVTTAKLHGATFMNQRRYENDFKVKR